LFDFRPDYLTPHAKKLEENKTATIRELFNGSDEEYKYYVSSTITKLVQERKNEQFGFH